MKLESVLQNKPPDQAAVTLQDALHVGRSVPHIPVSTGQRAAVCVSDCSDIPDRAEACEATDHVEKILHNPMRR